VQFHWQNQGYTDFEAFLARLSHARRKNIRQERRRVREAGIAFRWLEGAQIDAQHWEFFNRCYRTTYAAHGSSPYLSLEFFRRLGASLPQHVAMVVAERDARPLAGALFLRDAEALYGRYWGALEHVPLLHFECCYYQAIEYAIVRGLQTFEGGAQGEHKMARGLLPGPCRPIVQRDSTAREAAHPKSSLLPQRIDAKPTSRRAILLSLVIHCITLTCAWHHWAYAGLWPLADRVERSRSRVMPTKERRFGNGQGISVSSHDRP
jgi:hypothetical protein